LTANEKKTVQGGLEREDPLRRTISMRRILDGGPTVYPHGKDPFFVMKNPNNPVTIIFLAELKDDH
jgi:hypothetical protein